MNAQVIVGLVSSLLGGVVVALVTYLTTRQRVAAETRKLDAEAERTKAETSKILSEMSTPQKRISPSGTTPQGWQVAGSEPDDYEIGTDTSVARSGSRSGYISSRPDARGFGTLMQTFKANNYRGMRLCLSAFIRTADVERWAGLWMRVDGPDDTTLAFDNMSDRPISGTTEWRRYRIVLDVPEPSETISFGILLLGEGSAWIDDVAIDIVGTDIPTTVTVKPVAELPPRPINLDFDA